MAGLGMTSFSGQFCTPYLTIKRIALNDVMTVAKKKSGEKAINFDDRKSFSITITGSRGQLVPSLSGLFVHFQLKACLPYLLACQLLPFQPILYKPTSVGLICTTEILWLNCLFQVYFSAKDYFACLVLTAITVISYKPTSVRIICTLLWFLIWGLFSNIDVEVIL